MLCFAIDANGIKIWLYELGRFDKATEVLIVNIQ